MAERVQPMKHGQGKHTSRKEDGFRMILRQCLRMTQRMLTPYWHIDMNAGSGYNAVAECMGSPLVFLEEASDVGRSFNALFCDNDPAAVEQLRNATFFAVEATDSSALSVVCKDNREALGDFSRWITAEEPRPEYAMGTCLCDPNGSRALPVSAIAHFANRFPRIDLVLNVNVSLFARVRKCKGNPKTPGFDEFPDPEDVLGLKSHKSHWLVRNPPKGGRESFVIFLGRNTEEGMTRFEEFYPLDSTRGEGIVKTLKRVRPDQPLLWEDWPNGS